MPGTIAWGPAIPFWPTWELEVRVGPAQEARAGVGSQGGGLQTQTVRGSSRACQPVPSAPSPTESDGAFSKNLLLPLVVPAVAAAVPLIACSFCVGLVSSVGFETGTQITNFLEGGKCSET